MVLRQFQRHLTNAGTIAGNSGPDAVLFAGGNDRLIVDPGAVFLGNVDGGAGSNVLEMAPGGSGVLYGLGSSFINFATVTVDAGANWALTGVNTIGNGSTLSIPARSPMTALSSSRRAP